MGQVSSRTLNAQPAARLLGAALARPIGPMPPPVAFTPSMG